MIVFAEKQLLAKSVRILSFMETVISEHQESQDIHVILDNHSIHERVNEWLCLHPNVLFHHNPTSASWVNQIEVRFSILSRSALDGFSTHSTKELDYQIKKFIVVKNNNPKPFLLRKREVKGAQLGSNV